MVLKVIRHNEKPSHDFTLTTSIEGIDASSYDALVIPGGLHLLLSLSGDGCALIQELVQRKCGGNCQCFLLDRTQMSCCKVMYEVQGNLLGIDAA